MGWIGTHRGPGFLEGSDCDTWSRTLAKTGYGGPDTPPHLAPKWVRGAGGARHAGRSVEELHVRDVEDERI